MIKKVILISTVFSFAILFNACKSKSSTEPNTSSVSGDFFPNGDGSSYKYSTVRTDSNGTQTSGTRSTTYSGTTDMNGITFQNQIDTITVNGYSTVAHSFFLKSDSSVVYALDTAGLSQTIPDSLKQIFQLQFDPTLKLLQLPLQDGATWPVFNLSLKISLGGGANLTFNVVNVSASYEGMEQVPLNLTTGNVTENAAKIKYTLKLSIPDTQNPLATPSSVTYISYAWLANNIGIVQWRGNGLISSVFGGGGINFADTTSTVTQSLVSYKIK